MRVLVTGSHGLIGTTLIDAPAGAGHAVSRVVRVTATARQREISWRPNHGIIDASALEGYDAVVHLAGVGILDHPVDQESEAGGAAEPGAGEVRFWPRPSPHRDGAHECGPRRRRQGLRLRPAGPGGTGVLSELARTWEDATRKAAEAGSGRFTFEAGWCSAGAVASWPGNYRPSSWDWADE